MIKFLKNIYHYFLALIGAILYRFPSKKLFIIGITGTKGKSTVIELLSKVLEENGKKVCFFSSVHIKVGNEIKKNTTGNTMPGRFFIQRFLGQAVKKNCDVALLEVTSQGTVQHRHKFIDFDIAGITCLHPEHIESHGSFDNYRAAKVSFFRYVADTGKKKRKVFFINAGSSDARYFEKAVINSTKTEGSGSNDLVFYNQRSFSINVLRGEKLNDFFASEFNSENAALVYEICKEMKIKENKIISSLKNFKGMEGRMEIIKAKDFDVLIDYAHTPGSFEVIYKFLKSQPYKRIITVFGSYGEGRDKWKRPELGKIADKYCDYIVLTNEGPGMEDPMEIINQIAEGVGDKSKIKIIEDRKDAIAYALEFAEKGDIVALLGKGHEAYINLGKEGKIPWNEKEITVNLLSNKI